MFDRWFCSTKCKLSQHAELACCFTLPVLDGFLQVQVETDIKEAKRGTVSLGAGLTLPISHGHVHITAEGCSGTHWYSMMLY